MMGKAEDRISNLPDPILHHILSFLETEVVARTSILSHRWKYIWTSIPNLVFESESWNRLGEPKYSDVDQFMNFVDGTLHRRSLSGDNINKFYLRSSHHLNESLVHSWISNVIRHNVKDLSLFLHAKQHPSCIPQSFFTCASLTSLQLRVFSDIDFPKYISFPRLKHLRLFFMELSNQFCHEIFSNSPVLEDLYLDYCQFCMPSICISIPTVKTLRIKASRNLENCALEIHAPSLVTLDHSGCVAKEYFLSSFPTLEEAVVNFYAARTGQFEAIGQFLRALTNVKCLTVKNLPLEVNNLSWNSPAYHNIKRLKVTQVVGSDVVVIALLKVMPNLESLVIEKGSPYDDDDGWASLDMVDTGSLFIHLKSVCFMPKFWGSVEISCVKVILRDAKALESLTIYYEYPRRPLNVTEEELMVQIESFPRASASCSFEISLGSQSKEVENFPSAA